MQGLVNSPTLFNIYTCDIINSYELNKNNDTHSIAYADDTIFYVAGDTPDEIQPKLEKIVNNINIHYSTWNLRVNPEKCVSILWRQPSRQISKKKRKQAEDFQITTHKPGTNEPAIIPTQKSVKYLGIQLDYLTRCTEHVDTQIIKARNTNKALFRLLHNKYISNRARIICYQLLIRPLLTYAIPIWWNLGAAQMEKMR